MMAQRTRGQHLTNQRSVSPALPLHPAGAVAFEQGFHFVHGGAVEIAHEGVLQAARGDGEFQRFLVRWSVSRP